jgi:hypothetical protein
MICLLSGHHLNIRETQIRHDTYDEERARLDERGCDPSFPPTKFWEWPVPRLPETAFLGMQVQSA